MPVSFPLPTLKTSSQKNLVSYSTDDKDLPTLEKLSAVIPRLSQDERVGLAIAALNEGFEPDTMDVDFGIIAAPFDRCIELIQDLSLPGKVALVRGLSELLAISLGIVPSRSSSPNLPPVPPLHPENSWTQLSLENAIALSKAGLIDPAVLAWLYPYRTLQTEALWVLVQATKNFSVLLEALESLESGRKPE
jgi:hypothetical protein